MWDQVWTHVITRARAEGGPWTVVAVGLALPMLTPMAARLTRHYADDPTDIPARYLRLYRTAAAHVATDRRCQLDWTVLAAIGKIETHHGRSELPGVHSGANSAGAQGPMQFLPATFAHYDQPIPPGGSNPPSHYNPVNATYAAARYLCDSGTREGRLRAAIYAYNHADWYVYHVLAQATEYRTASGRWV